MREQCMFKILRLTFMFQEAVSYQHKTNFQYYVDFVLILPSSSPNPNWGAEVVLIPHSPTTTTIQNSTFLSQISSFLMFHALKRNIWHIKMILGAIPSQWNVFLCQQMSFTPTKLPSKFKF